ncbi:uncharacterized protein LOC131873542 [Cryptomeria japonica]|uniref:uncharacterized protein LOC131873542 n=1 Tax=Cryptomeria japonica TaxID=3369 RepID=UPI0027DA2477|nr:uncharacterized protein LOC131873542 [Cryptomeria japonica]
MLEPTSKGESRTIMRTRNNQKRNRKPHWKTGNRRERPLAGAGEPSRTQTPRDGGPATCGGRGSQWVSRRGGGINNPQEAAATTRRKKRRQSAGGGGNTQGPKPVRRQRHAKEGEGVSGSSGAQGAKAGKASEQRTREPERAGNVAPRGEDQNKAQRARRGRSARASINAKKQRMEEEKTKGSPRGTSRSHGSGITPQQQRKNPSISNGR